MVKQFLNSFMWGLSQRTWNGSMRRSACLEAARRLLLRKMGCQGVKSTSTTREARPSTPHLRAQTRTKPWHRQSLRQRLSKLKQSKQRPPRSQWCSPVGPRPTCWRMSAFEQPPTHPKRQQVAQPPTHPQTKRPPAQAGGRLSQRCQSTRRA